MAAIVDGEVLPKQDRSLLIRSMKLECMHSEIQTDCGNLRHERLTLNWPSTPPLWHIDAVGGRPPHQTPGIPPARIIVATSDDEQALATCPLPLLTPIPAQAIPAIAALQAGIHCNDEQLAPEKTMTSALQLTQSELDPGAPTRE